ncbi:hypothetical protein L9F63_015486, partial [Diploptera punctata]
MDPEGRVALVTGGAQGIGLAIVKQLLANGVKGLSVCDMDSKYDETVRNLNEEFGKDRTIFIKTDVTKEEELKAAFKKTLEKFGGLDIVVNNAGICNDQMWKQVFLVNVNGVIQGTLLALKYMGKDEGGKGGVVINTSSIAGLGGGNGLPMYSATKAAVNEFTRNIGGEYFWNTTGVRVMAVCPGATETRLLSQTVMTYQKDWEKALEEQSKKNQPVQKPEIVAEAVLHMIRKGSSGSIWVSSGVNNMDPTGKVALVTGGARGIGFEICKELLRAGVK